MLYFDFDVTPSVTVTTLHVINQWISSLKDSHGIVSKLTGFFTNFLSLFGKPQGISEQGVPQFHAGPMCGGGIRHHKSQLIDLIVSKCLCKASEREQPDKKAHKIPP